MTRLTRHDARRILDGRDRSGRLGALLDAAAASARPAELGGEDDVLTAFRAAPRHAVRPSRRFLARFVVVKAVIAVALLGGVALAASSSLTPGGEGSPGQPVAEGGRADPAPNTPTEPVETPTAPTPSPSDTSIKPFKGEDGEDPPEPGRPSGKRLKQLCRLFLDDPRGARAEKDYPGLEERAGSLERVRRFCERLLGEGGDDGDGKGEDPQDTNPSPKPSASHEDTSGPGGPHNGPQGHKGLSARSDGTYVG
ncbi:hypothetical protein Afil01_60240 [Actinorhabdospora filicis]|uniref:Uncharacterized protein n=1 Tax=Actinorhabdospora filicis TaxID=1785913 RepID=A0A9W6W671_9ACTN|nr:hypothetical protein [Actinorhabdospora filicis]GLZ81217.1 hypothetical protein Afil01_60240 [Actinorhabdospora filicis]